MQKKEKNILLLCWLAYTVAYLGRYSYNSNITLIESAFGLYHGESGLVTTCFFFAYGIGQVVNGLLCKKYNKKYIIPFALSISSIINLSVFFGVPFSWYKYLWLINGFIQSTLWPSLVSVVSTNLKTENLKKGVLIMATPVSVGTIIIYGLSSVISLSGNFKITFIIASVCMLAVAVSWFFSYDKNTENIEVEKIITDKNDLKKVRIEKSAIILVVILAIFAIINNLTKDGLQTWVPAILRENYGLGDSLSIILSLVLPILGVFGAIVSTFLNRWIKNYIYLSAFLYLIATIFLVLVLIKLRTSAWITVLLCFGMIVLLMHGINNVITNLMPIVMRDKINSGLIVGVLNGFCYVGSTISSYGLGAIADRGGWNNVFILLTILSVVPIIISFIYFIVKKLMKKDKEDYEK